LSAVGSTNSSSSNAPDFDAVVKGKAAVLRAEEAGKLLLFTFARISAAGGMNVGDIFHQHSSLSSEASGSDGSVRPTADLRCKTQDICSKTIPLIWLAFLMHIPDTKLIGARWKGGPHRRGSGLKAN
jgi:hypothetical protein